MYFSALSVQSFGEDNASISETSQDYSVNNRYVGHSPRNTRGYDVLNNTIESANQNGESSLRLGVNRAVQEPGPIREDVEERQDNNGLQDRQSAAAVWTPPTFRTYRPPCNVDWLNPRVRDVLRKYKSSKINSREGAELITKITGSQVSTTTVRVKTRMLDELKRDCDFYLNKML
ncbi:unnamed protein product [Onchocerca flexuosa]|uniref:Uncharacterized protein n=1 Tax=Onchocerca flexuosa TaxID=387005 RepID=A0A3P7YSM1_9BILA|nr:unnamed protein product [Onchocerca flexuosa]